MFRKTSKLFFFDLLPTFLQNFKKYHLRSKVNSQLQNFSWRIKEMMASSIKPYKVKSDEYILKQRIGAGQFGQVQKCEHKQSSKIYAIKTILSPKLYIQAIQEEAMNMIKTDSDYVLQLIDHFYDESLGAYVLVTPYYKLGGVDTLMKNQWDFEGLLLFCYQISKALFDLSKNQILHLDLKPQNILIKGQGQYVVCDLGCSRKLENGNMSISRSIDVLKMSSANARGGGTPEYASPDLIINGQMTAYTDIWSLGVILYKIIYGRHPLAISLTKLYDKMNDFSSGKFKITYTETQENKKFNPIIQLVKRMLVCSNNKQLRITWGQILQHIYQIAHVQSKQVDYIVTNFDILLQFGDKISIISSATLHYFDKFEQHLKIHKISTSFLTKAICIFLLTLTREIIAHTKAITYGDLQFFLFENTRKYLTKKQKSYADYLDTQAVKLTKTYNVNIQIGVFNFARQTVVFEYGKFYKHLRKIPTPEHLIERIEFNKLLEIINFVAYENQFRYQNRKYLNKFITRLINN